MYVFFFDDFFSSPMARRGQSSSTWACSCASRMTTPHPKGHGKKRSGQSLATCLPMRDEGDQRGAAVGARHLAEAATHALELVNEGVYKKDSLSKLGIRARQRNNMPFCQLPQDRDPWEGEFLVPRLHCGWLPLVKQEKLFM